MSVEIINLQSFAERLQNAAGQVDPHDRICVTMPRGTQTSSEDRRSQATIRVSDGQREAYFHTPAAAEAKIREWVELLAGKIR